MINDGEGNGSYVLECEASQGPLKGAVSAQKALQGSETETREVAGRNGREIVFPRQGVIDLPYRQINDFLQKGYRKN